MPATYPKRVEICEVGPRDGFQFEKRDISTSLKLEIIENLIEAGLSRIQIASFVHPKWVPQMADAEKIVAAFSDRNDCILSALALNEKGVRRALDAHVHQIDLSIATNEIHSMANANMSVADGVASAMHMIRMVIESGGRPQIGLQTVFGYANPGDTSPDLVLELVAKFCELDIESISLADSTGMANPALVSEVLERVQAVTAGTPIVLHLHDTRGLGLANVTAALQSGIDRFDTSFGGLGGCPFIPGATGNIATEDTAYLCECLGIKTGINLEKVSRISKDYEEFRGSQLSGKMYRLLS